MISYSFGNLAFNKEYGESTIEMVIGAKANYDTPQSFLNMAICYLSEVVYTGYNVAEEYTGAYLKEGDFSSIVQKWLSSMNETVEINIDSITKIGRIKRSTSDWSTDEFLIETNDEYIILLWATSA